jgi:hypothetical protein
VGEHLHQIRKQTRAMSRKNDIATNHFIDSGPRMSTKKKPITNQHAFGSWSAREHASSSILGKVMIPEHYINTLAWVYTLPPRSRFIAGKKRPMINMPYEGGDGDDDGGRSQILETCTAYPSLKKEKEKGINPAGYRDALLLCA